jgi:hypothetical protein
MSDYQNKSNLTKRQKAFEKLTNDLAEFGANNSSTLIADNDMLSLVISEALNGVDISIRYPDMYRKMLNNSDLRQAFIDALGSVEEEQSESVTISLPVKPALTFLSRQDQLPTIIKIGADKWRSVWRQSVEQLQALFSPPELAYRSDPSLYEDPWITLLRGEAEIEGSVYTILLECSPAEKSDDALAVAFNLAVTLEANIALQQVPLEATLQWGLYNQRITIAEEGRTKFPDIPLAAILDEQLQNVKAELSLTLRKFS